MTTNGVLHDAPAREQLEQSLGDLPFDLARWRRLTELALAEGERRRERVREQVEQAFAEAEAAIRRLDGELDVLRRALALQPLQEECSPPENPPPPPPPPAAPLPVAGWVQALVAREEAPLPPPPEIKVGTRTGMGVGYRASLYLLEVAQASNTGGLTRRQAELATRGWGTATLRDGLKRLVDEGLLERVERGVYRLTDAGRSAPPAPPGMLPLKEPREEPEGALAHG